MLELRAALDTRAAIALLGWFVVTDAARAARQAGHVAACAKATGISAATLRRYAFAAGRFSGPQRERLARARDVKGRPLTP